MNKTYYNTKNAEGEPDTKATILVQNQIDFEPKVSVIIPVYNVEEYLRQCLDSVINQTLKEIEIICVDDGSTDSSLEILKEYAAKDRRITLITQQNNGAASARNNAIRIAKGKYLAFCDSDDWIDYNFYESLYKNSENASIDIIKGNTAKVYGTNIKKDSKLNNYIKTSPRKHIVSTFQYEWWSAIYKNSLIKENNIYFKKALLAEDQEFLCHILCCSQSYKIINDTYYYYYQNPNSLTHKITPNHILDLINMDYLILNYLKKYNIPTQDQYLVIRARLIYLMQYWNFCNKNNLEKFFLQNTYKFIEYLNKININNSQFKKINNMNKLKEYMNNKHNHKDAINTTFMTKFKLFNFIPILSIEQNISKPTIFCNSHNFMDTKPEFKRFLCHNIKFNSILMVEFNNFHCECLSGMVKYFLDLGYNIDVCISPSEMDLTPFSNILSSKINIFTMDKATIKHLLCHDIVEKYTHIYINSDMIYDGSFYPVFDYIGSEIKFPEEKIITMCHHADKYSYIEPKNDRFSVVALNKLPILEKKNYYMVNTHFFNSFIRTNKNEKINFICVGNIESKRKNHSLLFDAIDKLLQQKITNFKVTIIARAGDLDIPKHIKPYLDFKGKLSYTDMYNELEKADFYLPLFDPENKLHERYLNSGSSGSYQLIYGFTLPCIISRKFQTNVNGFNDNNSIGYDQNKDLSKAMKIAIEMSNSEYLDKVQQIKILADCIYNESLENLKKILKPKEAKYPNNFFISLGEHCFSRTVLTRHYLKQRKNQGELSCPFDLCVCPFSSTYNLIKNDFANYFDALEYDDNDELWVNKQYGIRYNHDKDCSKANKDKLIQRYTQRIENFRFLLKDIQQHVFVFSSVKTDINIKELCNLYKLLSDKCNYDIKLFFINIGKDELKNINLLTNYKNIYYAHIPNPYPNYWGEWYKYEYFNSIEGENFENNIINFITLKLKD